MESPQFNGIPVRTHKICFWSKDNKDILKFSPSFSPYLELSFTLCFCFKALFLIDVTDKSICSELFIQKHWSFLLLPDQKCLGISLDYLSTALDSTFFQHPKKSFLSYFSMKTLLVNTYWNCLIEAIPISTHKACFHGEIRNMFTKIPHLTRAMLSEKI